MRPGHRRRGGGRRLVHWEIVAIFVFLLKEREPKCLRKTELLSFRRKDTSPPSRVCKWTLTYLCLQTWCLYSTPYTFSNSLELSPKAPLPLRWYFHSRLRVGYFICKWWVSVAIPVRSSRPMTFQPAEGKTACLCGLKRPWVPLMTNTKQRQTGPDMHTATPLASPLNPCLGIITV